MVATINGTEEAADKALVVRNACKGATRAVPWLLRWVLRCTKSLQYGLPLITVNMPSAKWE